MKNRMKTKITKTMVMLSAVIMLLLICFGAYITYHIAVNEIGGARLDLLQQISDYNIVYLNTMENIVDDFESTMSDELAAGASVGAGVRSGMQSVRESVDTIGWSCTFDVIMKDGTVINWDDDTERAERIKNTYWYIMLWSGSVEPQWALSMRNAETNEYEMTYAIPIFDEQGNSRLVAVLNCISYSMPKKILSLNGENRVFYVVNENGKVISHTNSGIVGFSFYYMPEFENIVGSFNSYSIKNKNGQWILQTNYHSDVTQWTYVEEVSVFSILSEYESLIIMFVAFIFGGFILMIVTMLMVMRKMTEPLEAFATELQELRFDENNYSCQVTPQDKYSEIEVITRNFNIMIQKVVELIEQIKHNEREKRKAEYEFLQAQIEPHFLHNTLLSVKALIALGEPERAISMLENFSELLRVPLMRNDGNVTLTDEINLVRRFVAIMEYRFDMDIEVVSVIPECFKEVMLPRMILQPIVDNAIFHGFEDMPEDKKPVITITAYAREGTFVIQIIDNGHGMDKECTESLMRGVKKRRGAVGHGIGIPNVLNRIQLLYGPEARLSIDSEPGVGTRVQIMLPGYIKQPDNFMEAHSDEDNDNR